MSVNDEAFLPLAFVIITHERSGLFWKAYRSVQAAREVHPGEVDLIVVNSSAKRLLCDEDSGTCELHVPEASRAAEKRNLGWQQTQREWIVFMDDDCELAPGALETLARHANGSSPRVAGWFGITEFRGPRTAWFRLLDGTDFLADFTWARHEATLPWGPTSLATFRRSALAEVGAFDTSLPVPAGGEDVALCLRLRQAGYELRAISQTLVYHDTETWNTLRGNLRRAFDYGRAEATLQQLFPMFRRFDGEAWALFLLPYLLALVVIPPAVVALAFIVGLLLAEYAAEWRYSGKSPVTTLGLLVFRLAYRLGICRQTPPGWQLFTRFDWDALRNLSAPVRLRLGMSFLIKWGVMLGCLGAALTLIWLSWHIRGGRCAFWG